MHLTNHTHARKEDLKGELKAVWNLVERKHVEVKG